METTILTRLTHSSSSISRSCNAVLQSVGTTDTNVFLSPAPATDGGASVVVGDDDYEDDYDGSTILVVVVVVVARRFVKAWVCDN